MNHIKRMWMTIALLVPLSGCADQEKVHEALFWTNAQIKAMPAFDPDTQRIEVVAGESIILMTNDGYTYGRMSTAHASHHAVFFSLPQNLGEGQTYNVSPSDSTLHYHGFAGYNSWYLDPDQPARATIQIKSISDDAIKAHVEYEMTRVCGSQFSPPEQRQRWPLTKDKTVVFKRATVRQ
jgi:hypothetical protein